jgi:hypothetical protein
MISRSASSFTSKLKNRKFLFLSSAMIGGGVSIFFGYMLFKKDPEHQKSSVIDAECAGIDASHVGLSESEKSK